MNEISAFRHMLHTKTTQIFRREFRMETMTGTCYNKNRAKGTANNPPKTFCKQYLVPDAYDTRMFIQLLIKAQGLS